MESEGAKGAHALDLKENLVRRALALTIDHAILSVVTTLLAGFIIAGIFFGNPLAVFFGLPAGFLLRSSNSMGADPHPMIYMIALTVVFFIISLLYFSFFDSNGRRTPGKAAMHLEVLTEEGYFPGFVAVMKRTLLKSISGAIGGYFLGLFGAGLAMGVASFFDLRSSPSKKGDLRQRRSEIWAGTVVLLEDEDVPFGSISGFSGDWKKGKEERESRRIKLPSFSRGDKVPGAEKKRMRLFSKKEKVPDGTEPTKDKEEMVPVPPQEEADKTPPIDSTRSKELEKEEAVLRLMIDLDIDENRARALADSGYRRKEDLAEAIPQDLLMVKGINPTLAKRIIERSRTPSPE